ncbi:hypothetical protein FRC11_006556, partial [Ceratobasidium sp. 423]
VKEHLHHEEEAKWEEDDQWMEIVSKLGNKSATNRQPHLDHMFEWEQPGQSATADFDEILKRFSDQSEGEGNDTPNGGCIQAPVSSTPHPRARMPRSVCVNATTVEAGSNEEHRKAGPSFWDKGKWPKVDINEVCHEQKANAATKKRPSPKRVPEPAEEPTDAEVDDEGDDDNKDYILPETKTRKNKKPSREQSESPECAKLKLPKPTRSSSYCI